MTSGVQGIDISNLQGPSFPWQDWKDKIGFGMVKATEGDGFTDPDFGANWDHMWWLNATHTIPRFAYSFFRPGQDPVAQAAHLVDTVKGHGLLPGDNFVLDLEVTDGLKPAVVAERGVTFLRKVNELAPGHRVLVYTYPEFAKEGNCAGMGGWFAWIANYQVAKPTVPSMWPTWTFWQWTDTPVDRDVYNGTQAELLAFCRMPAKR